MRARAVSTMSLPTFLGIGAQKCATSWLAAMLRQHPEIFMPRKKELHFFNLRSHYRRGIEWYRACFAGGHEHRALGEFTPNYLWVNGGRVVIDDPTLNPDVARLVREALPAVKLIVSLRNPVDRAVSAFYHHIRARRIAPHRLLLDVAECFGIVSKGFYFSQLSEWYQYFPADQLLILIYELDIVRDRTHAIQSMYRFLDVSDQYIPAPLDRRYNVRSGSFFLYLNYYFPRTAAALATRWPALLRLDLPHIKVTPRERAELARIYQDENRNLEQLLGRDLSVWQFPSDS